MDELDIFLGKNYIVTYHDQLLNAIEETWSACQRDLSHVRMDPIICSTRSSILS